VLPAGLIGRSAASAMGFVSVMGSLNNQRNERVNLNWSVIAKVTKLTVTNFESLLSSTDMCLDDPGISSDH
jgi:hypothetical protein